MILGIDLGTYSVKTSTKVSFLSKYTVGKSFSENNTIEINGINYTLNEGEFSTDWDKSCKENTLILLYAAISKSTNDLINQIVLGLPVQQYKQKRDKLISLVENNRCANVNGKSILITDVSVAPEGAGSYYSVSAKFQDKIKGKQLIIVDIGGRTTDIILMNNGKIEDVKTVAVGMLNIYSEITDYVNTKYTQSFKLEEGENILDNGLFIDGEYKDISFVKPILINSFNSIYKELQLKYNLRKGYVYLTGGGGIKLQQPFKNRLKNLIVADSYFDNAMGFAKVGESLWQD